MIRDQHKLHLIPGPQRAAVFHLGRVEEQLLALFHLVVEEPEQAWREGVKESSMSCFNLLTLKIV